MLIAIVILSVGLLSSLFINYNLLKKVEKYEDDILLKNEYFDKITQMSSKAYEKIEELDMREAFESDDEVGFFFKNLKEMIVTLDAYSKNYTK